MQRIIIILLVVTAAVFVLKRFFNIIKGGCSPSGCGKCGCGTPPADKPTMITKE